MLESARPPCLEDLPGTPRAGAFICPTDGPAKALLEQAAAHYVRLRIAPDADDRLSAWLQRSPCHLCAWRRVSQAWELLGGTSRPA